MSRLILRCHFWSSNTMWLAFAANGFVVLCGCNAGGGRWDHYSAGGRYVGASVSISPEGSMILYSSPRSGHGDIYRVDFDDSSELRLTADPNYEGDPEYSPHGRRIVFVRERDRVAHIWIMNADGSNPVQLTSGPAYDFSPSFSPDGSQIVFARHVAERKFRPGTAASAEIFLMNADGTGVTRLTTNEQADWEPRFSPNGNKIVYSVSSEEIWIMDTDGRNNRLLGPGSSPAFAPDGKRIVFKSGKYGREISVMNLDGSLRKQVYVSQTYKSHPKFSPDGLHIFFLDEPGSRGVGEIVVIREDGSDLKRIARTD